MNKAYSQSEEGVSEVIIRCRFPPGESLGRKGRLESMGTKCTHDHSKRPE